MKYLLVDGKNLLWRAASVMPELHANGILTGAIFGFMNGLVAVADLVRPDKTVICWDDWDGGPRVRKAISKSYKLRVDETEERKELVKAVHIQHDELVDLLSHLGVRQARSLGWEADDVMGTLARKYGKKHDVRIYTGDKDLFQCLSERVHVVRSNYQGTMETVTPASFEEKHGITVDQYVDFKALVGDQSDGYGGCKGIGEKTAAIILKHFRTLDEVLRSVHHEPTRWYKSPKQTTIMPRWRDLVVAGEADIKTAKQLAKINTKADLKYVKRDLNMSAVTKQLRKWKMTTLLTRLSTLKTLAWERP